MPSWRFISGLTTIFHSDSYLVLQTVWGTARHSIVAKSTVIDDVPIKTISVIDRDFTALHVHRRNTLKSMDVHLNYITLHYIHIIYSGFLSQPCLTIR